MYVRRGTDVPGCDWYEETRSDGVETWCVEGVGGYKSPST
jgi:hypothetical protein